MFKGLKQEIMAKDMLSLRVAIGKLTHIHDGHLDKQSYLPDLNAEDIKYTDKEGGIIYITLPEFVNFRYQNSKEPEEAELKTKLQLMLQLMYQIVAPDFDKINIRNQELFAQLLSEHIISPCASFEKKKAKGTSTQKPSGTTASDTTPLLESEESEESAAATHPLGGTASLPSPGISAGNNKNSFHAPRSNTNTGDDNGKETQCNPNCCGIL